MLLPFILKLIHLLNRYMLNYKIFFSVLKEDTVKDLLPIPVCSHWALSPEAFIFSSFLWIIWKALYLSKHTCIHQRYLLIVISILWLGLREPYTTINVFTANLYLRCEYLLISVSFGLLLCFKYLLKPQEIDCLFSGSFPWLRSVSPKSWPCIQ